MTTQQTVNQIPPRGAPTPEVAQAAMSPPSRRELASWWKKFRKTTEKEDEKPVAVPGIFAVPLAESIRYANVAISLSNDQGESFIYGYVPIVVAKCGVFLKEKATDVEGIFRLSGSAKRIKDLQTIFNSPPKYGKGLDWTGYTVHDAANILRRYLNQLPEPIVPLTFYDRFRDPLRSHPARLVGEEANTTESSTFDNESAVATYQRLITELPPLNRQLLLYILDLLAVFSSKSDLNRMTAANLAAIFQPGIISHPNHDMAPSEYRLSQDVLIYLIENQDNFLIGMTGTAVDEKTVKDVESGAPTLVSPKTGVDRSASNSSAGADSLRKYGVRRNVSVSSRGSGGVSSPGTPTSGIPLASGSVVGGIARSNTLPTKKSPGLSSTRFQRPTDPSTPTSVVPGSPTTTVPRLGGDGVSSQAGTPSRSPIEPAPKTEANPVSNSADPTNEATSLVERLVGGDATKNGVAAPVTQQPTKERKISQSAKNFFSRSPTMGPVQSTDPSKEPRQPNRLKKKPKLPGSANESAQSSQNSLQAEAAAAFHTPLASPDLIVHARLDPLATSTPILSNTAPTPVAESQPPIHHGMPGPANDAAPSQSALKPPRSREASVHSRSSFSDLDAIEDPALRAEKAQKRGHRFGFSLSAKRDAESPLAPPPPIGQNAGARLSTSSIGSSNKPRKSFTGDSQLTQQLGTDTTGTAYPSVVPFPSQDSSEILKDNPSEPEKKGLFGKLKAKMSQSKEEKKEREMEKERAKSPPRSDAERAGSKNSLSAFAQEHLPRRGRSMDVQREEALPKVPEAPSTQETILHQPASTSDPQENTGG